MGFLKVCLLTLTAEFRSQESPPKESEVKIALVVALKLKRCTSLTCSPAVCRFRELYKLLQGRNISAGSICSLINDIDGGWRSSCKSVPLHPAIIKLQR